MHRKIYFLFFGTMLCLLLTSCSGRNFKDFTHSAPCPECKSDCSCVRCLNVSEQCPIHPWVKSDTEQKKQKDKVEATK